MRLDLTGSGHDQRRPRCFPDEFRHVYTSPRWASATTDTCEASSGAFRATASRLSRPTSTSAGRIGQRLGGRHPDPQAGIRTRSQADRDHLDVAGREARPGQDLAQPRDQVSAVARGRLGRRPRTAPPPPPRPIAARSVDVSSAKMFIQSTTITQLKATP